MSKEEIELLVTGRYFLESPSAVLIGRRLIEIIAGTKNELVIVAYRFTLAVSEFQNEFEKALVRGCRVILVLDNSYKDDSNSAVFIDYIDRMASKYNALEVWEFNGQMVNANGGYRSQLHAKMIVSDGNTAVVGSANFSRNGLKENHEVAVVLKDSSAHAIVSMIEGFIVGAKHDGHLKLRKPE